MDVQDEALLEHMMMQATCINSQLSADAEVVHVMGERAFVVTRLEVRVAQDAGAVSEQLLLSRKCRLHPTDVITQLLRQQNWFGKTLFQNSKRNLKTP